MISHVSIIEKVYKETMLYVFGRNITKYHRFETGKLKKYEKNLIL